MAIGERIHFFRTLRGMTQKYLGARLGLKKFDNPSYPQLFDNFTAWYEQASKLREGQISKEEYDEWRYHYSMKDSSAITASVDTDH